MTPFSPFFPIYDWDILAGKQHSFFPRLEGRALLLLPHGGGCSSNKRFPCHQFSSLGDLLQASPPFPLSFFRRTSIWAWPRDPRGSRSFFFPPLFLLENNYSGPPSFSFRAGWRLTLTVLLGIDFFFSLFLFFPPLERRLRVRPPPLFFSQTVIEEISLFSLPTLLLFSFFPSLFPFFPFFAR